MKTQAVCTERNLYGHADGERVELHNVKEVAQFIYDKGRYGDVLITDVEDNPFITTFGVFIDKIADMEYRRELLKALVPLQMGEQNTDDGMSMRM